MFPSGPVNFRAIYWLSRAKNICRAYNKKADDFTAGYTNSPSAWFSCFKAQADALFGGFGMNLTTAFYIFVSQALREGRITSEISLNGPSKETIAAMPETERIQQIRLWRDTLTWMNFLLICGDDKIYRQLHSSIQKGL